MNMVGVSGHMGNGVCKYQVGCTISSNIREMNLFAPLVLIALQDLNRSEAVWRIEDPTVLTMS